LEVIKKNLDFSIDVDKLCQLIVDNACNLVFDVYVPSPGIPCASKVPRELMGNEYQLFKLKGTTFSGHPTLTTLGNTLRSIMYAKYALYEL